MRRIFTIPLLFLLGCFLAVSLITPSLQSQSADIVPYAPAPPSGPTSGYTNISYNYTIYSTDHTAQWMFSWGDGTQSVWITVTAGADRITLPHQWTTSGTYVLQVQFKDQNTTGVWSTPLHITIAQQTTAEYPHSPRLISGAIQGYTNTSYTYWITATDPNQNPLQYRIHWDNDTISAWTTFTASGTPLSIAASWQNAGTQTMLIQARNTLGLATAWSPIASITMSPAGRPLTHIYRLSVNGTDYALELPSDTTARLRNTNSTAVTSVREIEPGTYLLDINGDGTWEYTYIPDTGVLTAYNPTHTESFTIPTIPLLILLIVIGIILVVVILFKLGILYVEEVPVNKK